MRSICFYFQVHQPFRLRTYRFFDIGSNHHYFDDYANKTILRKVADKCYLPTNQTMLDLIKEYGTAFKISYSLSGTAIDQFEMYAPDVLDSFKRLAETGCVEFIAETYAHSLSALKSKDEFSKQVNAQIKKVQHHFGQTPKTFRNTELIYSDGIGSMVADMGFQTMLTEGAKHVLGWKSPNYMYCNAINPKLKMLLKNFQLSDDIAFRFSQRTWNEWPLTTEKYVGWLNQVDPKQEVINLFMDYETFGEHQWADSGIFQFLRALPQKVYTHSNYTFKTPSEVSEILQPISPIHVPTPISWADEERDLTAWLGNELQDEAFNRLYEFEEKVKCCKDENILTDWKYLQTSDHFYYMCTKWFSDGDVHKYFNPYNTPYEAFINYMNALSDFIIRVEDMCKPASVIPQDVIKEEKPKNIVVEEPKKTPVPKIKTTAKIKKPLLAATKPVAKTKRTTVNKLDKAKEYLKSINLKKKINKELTGSTKIENSKSLEPVKEVKNTSSPGKTKTKADIKPKKTKEPKKDIKLSSKKPAVVITEKPSKSSKNGSKKKGDSEEKQKQKKKKNKKK